MPTLSFDAIAAEVRRRRWEKIETAWLNELPAVPPIDQGTVHGLSDLPDLASCAENMLKLGTQMCDGPVAGARGLVFEHGLAWLQRALNVLGSAEVELQNGYKTWSVSSAYQSSFFGARALLAFLGIAVLEFKERTFVLDAFPAPLKPNEEYSICKMATTGARFEHRALWALLQRTLSVTVAPIWPAIITNQVKSANVANFARQRNRVHYRINGWLFSDLNYPLHDPTYATFNYKLITDLDFDGDRDDLTFLMAFVLTQMCLDVLRALSKKSNISDQILKKLSLRITNEAYPRYASQLISA